jgi:hypothetical protein
MTTSVEGLRNKAICGFPAQGRDDVVRGTLPPSRNANESGEGPTGLSRLIAALPSAWVLMGP